MVFLSLFTLFDCKDVSIFSRKSTAYGQITEIGGSGVDSVAVRFTAVKLSSGKELLVVYTYANGNYSGTVDIPS